MTQPKKHLYISAVLFVALWTYLIIRVLTVFVIHDEISTKWTFMVPWHYLPYHGLIDANNHFLNTLLGGLAIRLFNSDAMWVIRLPNLLMFPLYFWSIYGLKRFFRHPTYFYWLLLLLTCSPFLVEFFGMARGYGISMALMMFAIQQTLVYATEGRIRHALIAAPIWALDVYANLTMIPMALIGMAYLVVLMWKYRQRAWIITLIVPLLLVGYAIKYALFLQEVGALYHGNQKGLIPTTFHSITPYIWLTAHPVLDGMLILAGISALWIGGVRFLKERNLADPGIAITILFLLSILNIYGQNLLLGVNFPEDRSALYLVISFFCALCFNLDQKNLKWPAYISMAITAVIFLGTANFTKSIYYHFEHFDEELLTMIPDQVEGIPPSVGGRYWMMDNEMSKVKHFPMRMCQEAIDPRDTLLDYIIMSRPHRPDIDEKYHAIHEDAISQLILFERNRILPRVKIDERNLHVNGNGQYNDLYNEVVERPLYMRCSGVLNPMTIYKDVVVVFSIEDNQTNEITSYQPVALTQSVAIRDDGSLPFDFTFSLQEFESTNHLKVYLMNNHQDSIRGDIKLEIYEIPGR